jgi:hypothetical protein
MVEDLLVADKVRRALQEPLTAEMADQSDAEDVTLRSRA